MSFPHGYENYSRWLASTMPQTWIVPEPVRTNDAELWGSCPLLPPILKDSHGSQLPSEVISANVSLGLGVACSYP